MEEVVNKLNELLSDLNVFYRKLQNYHWNIIGEHFFVLHQKLEEYYDKINEQIDEVAEHILMLGCQPLGTMKDYLEISKIQEASNENIKADKVLNSVVADMRVLKQIAMEIKKMADENGLYETSALMDDYMSDYSKKLWMLNQSMK